MKAIKHIMIIDDDYDDIQLLSEAIESVDPNISISSSTNGYDALSALSSPQQLPPDIIFLDMNMPRLDGKKCLEEVRKLERSWYAQIVVWSTSGSEADMSEIESLGAAYYLTKPNYFHEIVDIVLYLLTRGNKPSAAEHYLKELHFA